MQYNSNIRTRKINSFPYYKLTTVPQTIRFQNSLLCLLRFDGNMMCAIGMYYIPK